MSFDDPLFTPNYSNLAGLPIFPLRDVIGAVARYETDREGWVNGDDFQEKMSKYRNQLGPIVVRKIKAGSKGIMADKKEDIVFGTVYDFSNSFIDKKLFIKIVAAAKLTVPPELIEGKSKYGSPSEVASAAAKIRWEPIMAEKKEAERKVQEYVADLLDRGCSCDHEQMAEIVNSACDQEGQLVADMKLLSEKRILEVVRYVYKIKASHKIRGSRGFKRTRNCEFHPREK